MGRKVVIALAAVVLVVCISSIFYSKRVAARGTALDNGIEALRMGDYANALSILKKATERDPSNALAFYELGNAYYMLSRKQEAVHSWTEAFRLDPRMDKAYLARGSYYFSAGDFTASLRDFDQAALLRPSMEAYLQRGLTLQALGRHQLAIDSLDKALSRAPLKNRVIEDAREVSVKALEKEGPHHH